MHKIVMCLEIQPEFGFHPKKHPKPRGGVGRDSALARHDLTDAALVKLFFAMPLMTLGVVAAIHWQALRLWLKGAPFAARSPGPRSGMSVGRASSPTS